MFVPIAVLRAIPPAITIRTISVPAIAWGRVMRSRVSFVRLDDDARVEDDVDREVVESGGVVEAGGDDEGSADDVESADGGPIDFCLNTLKLNFTFWSILEEQHGSMTGSSDLHPCARGDGSRWTRSPILAR